MKSVFEEYMSNQNIWKTYGNLPLFVREKELIDASIIEPAKTNAGLRVLEAGTGSGRIAFRIKEQADVSIDAFDLLPSFIDQAERFKQQNRLDVRFFVKDAADLSGLANDGYDVLVYFQQLICHIPKESLRAAVAECARVCRPGGLLLLSYAAYDNRTLDRFLDLFLAAIRRMRKEPFSRQELPYLHTNDRNGKRVLNLSFFGRHQSILYWFKNGELEQSLAAAGFDVIQRHDTQKRIVYLVCRKRIDQS